VKSPKVIERHCLKSGVFHTFAPFLPSPRTVVFEVVAIRSAAIEKTALDGPSPQRFKIDGLARGTERSDFTTIRWHRWRSREELAKPSVPLITALL
jgi:hypothetical protein